MLCYKTNIGINLAATKTNFHLKNNLKLKWAIDQSPLPPSLSFYPVALFERFNIITIILFALNYEIEYNLKDEDVFIYFNNFTSFIFW